MIDLSLIVLTWNTRELVLGCLEQLEREVKCTSGLQVEIWVVDNGSQDGTAEAVRARFPDVRLLALPENVGFAAGNNAALAEVQGRIVCLINSDVLITHDALSRCVRVFGEMPDVGVAGLQLLHPDGRPQNSIHVFPGFWNELFPTFLSEWLFPKRFPSKRRPLRQVTPVAAIRGAVFFVRHETVKKVGMLSEDYFFFLEETDWCWQIREAGWQVVHVPGATAIHASGLSSKRVEPLRTRIEFHRSLYHFVRHRRGVGEAFFVRWLRLTKTVATGLSLVFLAPFGSRFRDRLHERWGLVAWHLRGRPSAAGLSGIGPITDTVDGKAQKRDSPPPESLSQSMRGGQE